MQNELYKIIYTTQNCFVHKISRANGQCGKKQLPGIWNVTTFGTLVSNEFPKT